MSRRQNSSIAIGTIVSMLLIILSILVGPYIIHTKAGTWFSLDKSTLALIIPLYSFVVAVVPMWLLVLPRSYLSTYMKVGVLALIVLAVCLINPELRMPMTTVFVAGNGPIIPGPAWPYVFVTIACGAISGFHALIGSGTTPKLIRDETDIPMVGMSAMLIEAMVAIVALITTATMFPEDYFAINASSTAFQALNMTVIDLPTINHLLGLDITHRPGGAISLAAGIAMLFKSFGYIVKYLFQFMLLFEAIFILTAIDAGARAGRHILHDILGSIYKPLGQTNWPSVLIISAFISVCWGVFIYTGSISSIWPLFGVTNQALAVSALAIGTTLILRANPNKWYALCTLIPLLFIATTTFTAGIMNISLYFRSLQNVNGCVTIITLTLVSIIIGDNAKVWIGIIRKQKNSSIIPS